MGLSSYFKAKKPEEKRRPTPATAIPPTEKGIFSQNPNDDFELQAPTPHFGSSRNSLRSSSGSVFLDDIKHEVMVNYMYQQQCCHYWVSDGSGEVEGVLLRKVRGQYMACPPQLAESTFATACTMLNLPVCSLPSHPHVQSTDIL